MQDFLKKLEETLKAYLKERYLPPHRARTPGWTYHDLQFFARGADLLSTAFTEGRTDLPKNYFNKKEFRSGFLLYFFIPTFVKVWKCLEQTPAFLKRRPLKILDLGCGPGTASLACSAFFKNQPLKIFGYEQNVNIRRDALALWKRLAPSHHHFRFVSKLMPNEKFDLTIASYFLSELPFKNQIDLSTYALTHSRTFIIIEPALQKTTRQLMALRDRLLGMGSAQVLAPCLHQQNCPMLAANQRDWCHFYIDWKCPLIIRQVDELIGNKHDYLKMAYLVIARPAASGPKQSRGILGAASASPRSDFVTSSPSAPRNDTWRVVSSPLISKGKKEFILCGANGRLEKIVRLNRDRNPGETFDQIQRGDILEGEICHDRIMIRDRFVLKS